MRADDPRHGTNAGYLTHYRDGERPCTPCADGRAIAKKRAAYERHRGVKVVHSAGEVALVIAPWLRMGLTLGAVAVAAGLGESASGTIYQVLREDRPVRRSTYNALAGVVEKDIADTAKIDADLTKRRVYSLMAIGHRVSDMPILTRGAWRSRDKISVGTARDMRAYYAENEFKIGPNRQGQSRARNRGWKPPLAWDDPGTLGWPDAIKTPFDMSTPRATYLADDLLEEVRHLTSFGVSMHQVSRQLGVSIKAIEKAGERVAQREAS